MPEAPERLVLDRVRSLSVSGERIASNSNHIGALHRLAGGMEQLYTLVKRTEDHIHSLPGGPPVLAWGGLRGLGVADATELLLHNAFDWYSINATRYFRLAGFICDELDGSDRVEAARSYMVEVCGPLYTFRNKVSAHHALTDPRRDTLSDQHTSTFSTLAFEGGRLFVGAVLMHVDEPDKPAETSHDLRWSLSEFHERIFLPRTGGSATTIVSPGGAARFGARTWASTRVTP